MKKTLITVLLIIITVFSVDSLIAAEPQTHQGSKSVYFGFSGLSNLGIDGSYIGCSYLFADRLGVFSDINFGFKNTSPGSNQTDLKDNSFGMSAGIIWYVMQKGPIAFYFGPQISVNTHYADMNDNGITYKLNETTYDAACSISVEWWAFENISFFGGVYVGYEYLSGTKDYGYNNKVDYSTRNIGFISKSSSLGVSFYF
jgi:hypothetical protein